MVSLLFFGFFIGMRHALDADHLAAVASISDRLREGGIAYIEVPDISHYRSYDPAEHVTFFEHINHFTSWHLADAFVRNHFAIEQFGQSVLTSCLGQIV